MIEFKTIPIYFRNPSFNSFQNELMNFFIFLSKVHPAFLLDNSLLAKMQKQADFLCDLLADESSWNLSKFQIWVNKFIRNLNDAHSHIEVCQSILYPYTVRFYEGVFYIYSTTLQHKNTLGKTITAINNIPISIIHAQMSKWIPAENSIKSGIVGSYFLNNPHFLESIGIQYSNKLSIHFSDNDKEEFNLNDIKKEILVFQTNVNPLTCPQNSFFHYKIIDSICYFQFNNMYDKLSYQINCSILNKECDKETLTRLPDFESFLKNMYADMHKQHINTLVVDMRNNGGGNSLLGDILLETLVPKNIHFKTYTTFTRISDFLKENSYYYSSSNIANNKLINIKRLPSIKEWEMRPHLEEQFQGKIFFIQGQNTFSSANYLLTTIKDNKLFPIIGSNTSQSPTCFGDVIPILLPFTKTKGYISHSYFQRPCVELKNEPTLSPNFTIKNSFYEKSQGKDLCIEWIKKQIL